MTSNGSLNKPLSFKGERHDLWKKKIIVFIKGMDFEMWKTVKNGPFVLTHEDINVVVNHKEDDWTKY